jgi:DMSO reductase anchor subunit
MHPAYSVIFFTTASGAGYGLLIWLAAGAALGLVPVAPALGWIGLGLALALVTSGLFASTLHLGRPERAWRAFSQWRTSWLSREGVAAIATYIPAGVLGLGWVFGEAVPGQIAVAAWLTIASALVTLWCTGMIYASLPTIRAWHHPLVAPLYIVLALATGGVLLIALLLGFGFELRWAAMAAIAALIAAFVMKLAYWHALDAGKSPHTIGSATGLGRFGTVRQLDPPHTQANFVMREMGYQVARRHAANLRRIATALLFLVPTLGALVQLANPGLPLQLGAALLAVVSAAIGVLVERWLFFAEAEHVVTLYYGR